MRTCGSVWGLALLLLAACASTARERMGASPDELRRSYPPERYVVGVGEGASLELARRRAAVEISSQLGGSIHAQGWVEAESGHSGGSRIESERVGEQIHVRTELARMEWIEVVSARTVGEKVEVLAVLDRRQAAERLRAEIDARAATLEGELQGALRTKGVLARARALSALEGERRALLESLGLWASLSRRSSFHPRVLDAFEQARDELRSRLGEVEWELCLEGENEAAPPSLFLGRLAQRGLVARACGSPPSEAERWRLQGELAAAIQRMNHPGGYPFFCSTRLTYRIVNGEEGLEAGGLANGIRSGAHGADAACALSLDALATDFLKGIGWTSISAESGAEPTFAGP